MDDVQPCLDSSDLTELSIPQQLYLKPEAKLSLTVALPAVRLPGKTISNWEVTERLRQAVEPHSFQMIKVTKSTLEFIRFEAEIENRSQIPAILNILAGKVIRLSGFPEPLKIRAAEAKPDFPAKHDWDRYFRDAKNMNEMKPGERPDTVHVSGLPSKWFAGKRSHQDSDKPNEQTLKRIFEMYGEIRSVDIPMLDPYRNHMKASISGIKTFSYDTDAKFDAYVQYRDYMSFVRAMDALRGMKLVYKQGVKIFSASIKVDFDKTKHLSDASIQRRKIERDKLMEKEREKDEEKKREDDAVRRALQEEQRKKQEEKRLKGERRKEREEKRKQKILKKLKRKEAEQMSIKIAIEERKLLMAQRKLESIRLLDELFERVKVERQKEITKEKEKDIETQLSKAKIKQEKKLKKKEKEQMKKKEEMVDKERELRKKLVKKIKDRQEQHMEDRWQRLKRTLEDKNTLRSALKAKNGQESSSHMNSDSFRGGYRGRFLPRRPLPSHHRNEHQDYKEKSDPKNKEASSDAESSATSKYSHLNSSTDEEVQKPPKETWPGYEAMALSEGKHPWVGYSDFYNPRFMRRGGRRGRGGFRGAMRGGFGPSLNPNVPVNSFYMQPINDSYYRYFNKLTKGENAGRSRSRSRSSDRVVCRKVLSRSRSQSKSSRSSRSRSRSDSRKSSKSRATEEKGKTSDTAREPSELSLSLSASDGFDSPERKATPLGKPGWEPRFPRARDFNYDRPFSNYRQRLNSSSPRIKSSIVRKSRSRSRNRDEGKGSLHREGKKSPRPVSEERADKSGDRDKRKREQTDKSKKSVHKDKKKKKRSDKKLKKSK